MKIVKKSRISTILEPAKRLPFFSMENLGGSEKDNNYLKTLISRYVKRGVIIRLKKGKYVSREYVKSLERRQEVDEYLEWVGCKLYESAYISLDYVLAKHSAITEMPQVLTFMSDKKPVVFRNILGVFAYRHIKPTLFTGYSIIKKGSFYIPTATLAKALFDWLYLRQYSLVDSEAIKELRLNGNVLTPSNWKELNKWCQQSKSKNMKSIFKLIYAEYHS